MPGGLPDHSFEFQVPSIEVGFPPGLNTVLASTVVRHEPKDPSGYEITLTRLSDLSQSCQN